MRLSSCVPFQLYALPPVSCAPSAVAVAVKSMAAAASAVMKVCLCVVFISRLFY